MLYSQNAKLMKQYIDYSYKDKIKQLVDNGFDLNSTVIYTQKNFPKSVTRKSGSIRCFVKVRQNVYNKPKQIKKQNFVSHFNTLSYVIYIKKLKIKIKVSC
jgi:hypothetical protein